MLNFVYFGSIADPSRSYHMEFVYESEDEAAGVQSLLRHFALEVGLTERKNRYVVYSKDGESISRMLALMGASDSLLKFENIRVLKEMRGSVQRRVNCETANLQKTVRASVRQIDDIRYIRDRVGFESLPDSLSELAQLRLSMPDATMQELSAALSSPVGKSGVNHRLRKLSEIAEHLRDTETKTDP